MLYYIKQSKSFENIITVENGLQEKKTLKGAQHMSLFLGEKIREAGGTIKMRFKVKKISQDQHAVRVVSEEGE